MNIDGFQELIADIHAMAEKIDADGAGAGTAAHILEDAAKPIHDQIQGRAGAHQSGYVRHASGTAAESAGTGRKGGTVR